MKWNTAGTQALCRIPGDVECMLKHSASKCFSVAFWVHTTKALRERERERERVIHMQYTKENCARKFYILLGN
jgi:hypothetical protein